MRLRVLFLIIVLVGCGLPQEPEIRIGMSENEVNQITHCAVRPNSLMTFSAKFSDACEVVINGNNFNLAFDENKQVFHISTNDKKYRLSNGLGVGSAFADIKKAYMSYKVEHILGYGRMVVINDDVTFGFEWLSRDKLKVSDEERVIWLQLKSIDIK